MLKDETMKKYDSLKRRATTRSGIVTQEEIQWLVEEVERLRSVVRKLQSITSKRLKTLVKKSSKDNS